MNKSVILTYPILTGHGGMETVLIGLLNNYAGKEKMQLFLPGGSVDKTWLGQIDDKSEKIVLHDKRLKISQFIDTFMYMLANKPKVVIVMSKWQILPIFLTKLFNKSLKIVSWNHFSLSNTRFTKLLKLLRLCDYHLSISSGITQQLISLGIDKADIFTIYNPVKRADRLVGRCTDDVRQLLYVGRVQFEGQKNLKEMFLILSRLQGIKWKLSIIGSGEDKEVTQLKNLSKELKIADSIEWLGWKSQPWKSVNMADALLLTSNFEGFGMALAESVAHGIPVFSSNCLTGPEDIVEKGNGVMYSLHNIPDGSRKLQSLLEDSQLYRDPARVASTIENFYEDKYFSRFENVLNEILN